MLGKSTEPKSYACRNGPSALCFLVNYKSHAIPFFISSNLLPLDLLYFKSVAILMHDVFNNLSPPQITNSFNFQSNIHPYNTRPSSRGNFFVQYSRLEKQSKSFSRVGVKVWNSLPCCVTRLKRILNAKLIICFFKNSRRQMITLTYLIWLKFKIFWKLSVLYLHNPTHFCQHYLNVLVHYISYYGFVRLTWLNLSIQSNITFLSFFFFTLNISVK